MKICIGCWQIFNKAFWNAVQSKPVRVFKIAFQFLTPSKKENILSEKMGKKIMFLAKNHKFLEFSKSLFYTSKMHYFDYQIIFGVKCNSKWGQTNKENLVSISHHLNFGVF